MSSEDPDFDGTAAHGPAAISMEQQWFHVKSTPQALKTLRDRT